MIPSHGISRRFNPCSAHNILADRTQHAATLLAAVCVLVACEDKQRREVSRAPISSPADKAPLRPELIAVPIQDGPPITIGFDWAPPCRVPALQDVNKDGVHVRLAFDVVLERTQDGLVMRLDKLRVAEPDGTATQAELERMMKMLEGAIPPIKIADTGESEGALDIDKAMDAVLAELAKTSGNPQTMKQVRNLLTSPTFKAAFAQKAGETWDVWVGSWTGIKIAPNETQRVKYDLPSALGTFKDVPLTTTHHGSVRDAPSLVLLSAEQTIEGPELAQMMSGFVQQVVPDDKAKIEFKDARKVDRNTVAIDPSNGRPHRALHEMEIEVSGKRSKRTRDTGFDWSRATGCVAKAPTGSAK